MFVLTIFKYFIVLFCKPSIVPKDPEIAFKKTLLKFPHLHIRRGIVEKSTKEKRGIYGSVSARS
jgi:hypothetical protein